MNTKQTEQKDSVFYLPAAGMLNLTHASLEAVDCTISRVRYSRDRRKMVPLVDACPDFRRSI